MKKLIYTLLFVCCILIVVPCNKVYAQTCSLSMCNGSLLNDPFTNSSVWTDLSSGQILVNGELMINGTGSYSAFRRHREVLLPSRFYADFKVTILNSNNPQHYILGFTTLATEPINSTGNRGIFIFLNSPAATQLPNSCTFGQCPWFINLGYNDGQSVITYSTGSIPINSLGVYYMRFVRVGTAFLLQVYNNPSFTSLIGSIFWDTFTFCPTINTKFIQAGKGGTYPWRTSQIRVDNLKICNLSSSQPPCTFTSAQCRLSGFDQEVENDQYIHNKPLIYPNPSQGQFKLELNNKTSISSIKLMDACGRLVDIDLSKIDDINQINIINRQAGVYFLEIIDEVGTKHTEKIIVN